MSRSSSHGILSSISKRIALAGASPLLPTRTTTCDAWAISRSIKTDGCLAARISATMSAFRFADFAVYQAATDVAIAATAVAPAERLSESIIAVATGTAQVPHPHERARSGGTGSAERS